MKPAVQTDRCGDMLMKLASAKYVMHPDRDLFAGVVKAETISVLDSDDQSTSTGVVRENGEDTSARWCSADRFSNNQKMEELAEAAERGAHESDAADQAGG
jgi:hypothetical protein